MSKSRSSQSQEQNTVEQSSGQNRATTRSNSAMAENLANGGMGMSQHATGGNQMANQHLQENAPDLQCEHPSPELGSRRAGAPTSKRAALARHKRNQKKVQQIIRSGLAQQVDPSAGANSRVNLLRNTCQWIEAGEANLFVLTPTHDSHLRPACPADKVAYFDNNTTEQTRRLLLGMI